MAILSKQAILCAVDLPVEQVEVPEWGGAVLVRTMSAAEREEFASHSESMAKDGRSRAALLAALAMCDESGERMFSDEEVIDLGKKSAKALDRVVAVIMKINAMGPDQLDAAKND